MAVTTFLPVIGRHAVAIPVGDSINEIRYACAPGTPVFSILDGSLSFTEDGMSVRSLKGRLIVTYLGVDQAEAGTMQADVLAAGQFIGRVTGRDGAPGLFVRANLGDDLHDIATLLSDADDPAVMWPKGVGQIARPSNPVGPARSKPTADSPRTAEEEPSRNRSVRSAPPILQSSEEPDPESPIDATFEEPQPAIEVDADVTIEAGVEAEIVVEVDLDANADAGLEVTVEPEVELEAEVPALPALDVDQVSDESAQPAEEVGSDEVIESPAEDAPGSPSSASTSAASHRLAAKRERPAPASKRRSR